MGLYYRNAVLQHAKPRLARLDCIMNMIYFAVVQIASLVYSTARIGMYCSDDRGERSHIRSHPKYSRGPLLSNRVGHAHR